VIAPKQKARLGDRLLEAGLVTQTQLDLALREQKRRGGHLGEILSDLGFVQPEIISQFLAREARTKLVNVSRMVIDKTVLHTVPLEMAKRLRVLPLARENNTLTIAVADPFNVVAIDTLEQVTGMQIEVVTASERDILNCLERHYTEGDTVEESIDRLLEEGPDKLRENQEGRPEVGGSMAGDPPVIRLVDQIIARAVNNRASDIHFEPEERIMRIRMRIDGVLYQDVLIPKPMQSPVTARLKIMGDLDVAEQRIPQDGRTTVYVGRREVNLRISSLPVTFGENLVVRILDPTSMVLSLPALGFAADDHQSFLSILQKPYGVVLVTGPTGSGKTTTLYAALHEVSTMEHSVFTLEDPVEYRMPVIRQTQIKEDIGMTFGNGLRALLRQDPDVILVGETRDTETAQLMVRAALTGHLVFSTLHTNDAAGAIPRLVDMGVEPYLLPSSLLAVLGQRLVRTVCNQCKQRVENPERVFEELKAQPPAGMPVQLWRGAGCPECKSSGYKGRLGIFELMAVDDRFHDPIVRRSGAPVFFKLARERGMRTMFEDGMTKAIQGGTTMQEVLRVTRLTAE
jgi:type IV pilus assembly protein PilB